MRCRVSKFVSQQITQQLIETHAERSARLVVDFGGLVGRGRERRSGKVVAIGYGLSNVTLHANEFGSADII